MNLRLTISLFGLQHKRISDQLEILFGKLERVLEAKQIELLSLDLILNQLGNVDMLTLLGAWIRQVLPCDLEIIKDVLIYCLEMS